MQSISRKRCSQGRAYSTCHRRLHVGLGVGVLQNSPYFEAETPQALVVTSLHT